MITRTHLAHVPGNISIPESACASMQEVTREEHPQGFSQEHFQERPMKQALPLVPPGTA